MLSLGLLLHWQFVLYPGKRDIGLGAAKLPQGGACDLVISGHGGSGCQDTMSADEVAALTQRLARKADRLVVVAADELGIGRDAEIQRRGWIARAEPQRAADRQISFRPPSGIAESCAVEGLRKGKVRIE